MSEVNLNAEELVEIRRIAREIMEGMDCVNPSVFERHIVAVLARNVTAAQRSYEAALAAEETHTWEFGSHQISECQVDWCGRYRGQRRDSELRPAHVFGQDCPNYPYGCVICLPGRTVAKPGKPRS